MSSEKKQKVLLKRSNIPNRIISASTIEYGELAMNYASGETSAFLSFKKSGDTIAMIREQAWNDENYESKGACLPLSGGEMTGSIIMPNDDNKGIYPLFDAYGKIGKSDKRFYEMHALRFYGDYFYGLASSSQTSQLADEVLFEGIPTGTTSGTVAVGNHTHEYLPLSGGTIEGTLQTLSYGAAVIPLNDGNGTIGETKRKYSNVYSYDITSEDIHTNKLNLSTKSDVNTDIIRINNTHENSGFGYTFSYLGGGQGNDNALALYSDEYKSGPLFKILQDGQIVGNESNAVKTLVTSAITATTAKTASKVSKKLTIGSKTYDGSSAITIDASDFGLSSALKYCGKTTSVLSGNGATTNPIMINGEEHSATTGCVVTTAANKEYAWDGTKWIELGDESSFKIKQTPKTDPTADGSGTTFIASITQDANGDITATKQALDLSNYSLTSHTHNDVYATTEELEEVALAATTAIATFNESAGFGDDGKSKLSSGMSLTSAIVKLQESSSSLSGALIADEFVIANALTTINASAGFNEDGTSTLPSGMSLTDAINAKPDTDTLNTVGATNYTSSDRAQFIVVTSGASASKQSYTISDIWAEGGVLYVGRGRTKIGAGIETGSNNMYNIGSTGYRFKESFINIMHGLADSATTATSATTAKSATTADSATTAKSATTATSAVSATTAKSATTAVSATTAKYALSLSGGAMTGPITFNLTDADKNVIRINNGTYTDSTIGQYGYTLKYLGSGSGDDNSLALFSDNCAATAQNKSVEIKQSGNIHARSIIPLANNTYDLGSSNLKWENVYATTFNGKAKSATTADSATTAKSATTANSATTATSATTADKAVKDSSGNNIANTYLKNTHVNVSGTTGASNNFGHVKLASGELSGKTYVNGEAAASYHQHSNYAASSHVNESATPYALGHVKLVSGELSGKSYTSGEAAASYHTHSNYAPILHVNVSGTTGTINNFGHVKLASGELSGKTGAVNGEAAASFHQHSNYATTGHNHDGRYSLTSHTHSDYVTSGTLVDVEDVIVKTFDKVRTSCGLSNDFNSPFSGYSLSEAINDHKHDANAITSGVIGIEYLPTGTSSRQVAKGNHTHTRTFSSTTGKCHLLGWSSKSGTSTTMTFYTSSTDVYMQGGNLYAASDERLKDFAGDVDVDLDDIKRIPKKYYTWKDDENKTIQMGTSAQKLQEIYPELVSESEDGKLAVSYDKLTMVALGAIDKLYEMVKDLKEENKILRKEIDNLKK